jgi:hypothetical protein
MNAGGAQKISRYCLRDSLDKQEIILKRDLKIAI